MSKVILDLNNKQVEKIVESLPMEEKLRLVRKLEQETWARRLDKVVQRIRKRFRENPLSDKEITRICEEVRRKRYEKAKSSR